MDTRTLLNQLGYSESPFFLEGEHLSTDPGYSHVFRKAQNPACALVGVYVLRRPLIGSENAGAIIPTVYVCEAESEEKAHDIHKLVWNQNTVPFLVVATPTKFRIYRGFSFRGGRELQQDQHICEVARDARNVLSALQDFQAKSINSGMLWARRGREISVASRVDKQLLSSLKQLSDHLKSEGLARGVGHTLIGKYVYLWYLRHRGILSDERFEKFQIEPDTVLGRNPDVDALYALQERLDEWLNGSVFPLPKRRISGKYVSEVAKAFLGDEPGSGQAHLGFDAYDFSYIPIETLSVVYQQFLHAEGGGRAKGAYYTPSWLVNMVLDELEAKRPLQDGMKVFDPSCGSGAFLVQCYRRLIERELRHYEKISPVRLRELLTKNIYGLEVDEDACNVSELSLILTLLDYVDPPDLSNTNFKLPALRGKNIFACDGGFLDSDSEWNRSKQGKGYALVVGNPPWKQLRESELKSESDRKAFAWIKTNHRRCPVDNYQIAEAFTWKAAEVVDKGGTIALLVPASVLFNKQARKFRRRFFQKMKTDLVINLANMRHLIFEGADSPCAMLAYAPCDSASSVANGPVLTYAPFVVEQFSRYIEPYVDKRETVWTIVIAHNNVWELKRSEVADGEGLHWKLAMWATPRDRHLLDTLARRFVPLRKFVKENELVLSQGVELRRQQAGRRVNYKTVTALPEVVGENKLVMKELKGIGRVYRFDRTMLQEIVPDEGYVRKGRDVVTIAVCRPPHVIVDAARRFFVFAGDEYIVIPPRQIGIAGGRVKAELLKALAAYLNSDFVLYHQYLTSGLWGVERDRPNLDDLKNLPMPFDESACQDIHELGLLYDQLVSAADQQQGFGPLYEGAATRSLEDVCGRLNSMVYNLLGIRPSEQVLITDLLNVRMKLNEGNIAREAIAPADEAEMSAYASLLKGELDEFLEAGSRHRVKVYYSKELAVIEIRNFERGEVGPATVREVTDETKREFRKIQDNLAKKDAQWIYFDKGLRVFDGRTTYIYKPRERLYWLQSQALVDADEFIAEKLAGGERRD